MAIELSDNVRKVFYAMQSQESSRTAVANTLVSAGIGLMQKKKFGEAAAAFKRATAMQPDNIDAYNMLGQAYTNLGKKKEAIEAYKLSLKLDRQQDQVYNAIANLYIDIKQPADAEKQLKEAVKVNRLNTLAFYTLGHLQVQGGKFAEAEASFRQVVKLEPKDGNSYYALGMALSREGKFDDAITQLQQAVKLKRDFAPALTELGKAYIATGEPAKAQEQIDLLKKIQTTDAALSAAELAAEIRQPKIYFYNSTESTLQLSLTPMSLLALDPTTFTTAGSSREYSVVFNFDSEMDPSSVMNINNWQISKSGGGAAGIYNNGLYSPKEATIPIIPNRVSYDPTSREARVVFTLRQNATNDAVIDPKHIVFKFLGKDLRGKTMDPTADQYDGFAKVPF